MPRPLVRLNRNGKPAPPVAVNPVAQTPSQGSNPAGNNSP